MIESPCKFNFRQLTFPQGRIRPSGGTAVAPTKPDTKPEPKRTAPPSPAPHPQPHPTKVPQPGKQPGPSRRVLPGVCPIKE